MSKGVEYERFVTEYLEQLGYDNIEVTEVTGDFGIDILAYKNGFKWGFQCKEYSSPVGVRAVQEAVAGKAYYACDLVGVITNSTFTKAAQELAEAADVVLLDEVMPVEEWQLESDTEIIKQYDMEMVAWKLSPSTLLHIGWTYDFDLANIEEDEMGNFLIMGGGGSGKSTLMDCLLQQILRWPPWYRRVILIDCIGLQFGQYKEFPHLLLPVINEPRRAVGLVEWTLKEIQQRILTMASKGMRNYQAYNKMQEETDDAYMMPEIFIFIDDVYEALKAARVEAVREVLTKGPRVGIYTVAAVRSPIMLKDEMMRELYYSSQYKAVFNTQIPKDKWIARDSWQTVKRLPQGECVFYRPGATGKSVRIFQTSPEQQESYCKRCLDDWRERLEIQLPRADDPPKPKTEEHKPKKKKRGLSFLSKIGKR